MVKIKEWSLHFTRENACYSSDFKYMWNTRENIHMHPWDRDIEIRGKKWMKLQQTWEGFMALSIVGFISVWFSALWTPNALVVFGSQFKYIFSMGFSSEYSLIYLCNNKIIARTFSLPHSTFYNYWIKRIRILKIWKYQLKRIFTLFKNRYAHQISTPS